MLGRGGSSAFRPFLAQLDHKEMRKEKEMLKITDANNFRRTAVGLCLIAGPLAALIGALVAPWEGTDETAAWLQVLAENPVRGQIGAVLLYLGYLLVAVGVFGMIHLLRSRAVVLGHVAGALAIWGWVTLPGLLITDFYDLSLAEALGPQEGAAIAERGQDYAGAAIMGIPVLLGMVGLLLLAVALWRAGFAPAWVPLVLLVGNAAGSYDAYSLAFVTTWWALWLVALGYLGLQVLRMSDEDWERGVVPAIGGTAGTAARPRVQ